MASIDFTDMGYDMIAGTVLGGVAGIVEFTLASAVSSVGSTFLTPSLVTPFAIITGALVFAGAVLMKVGSKMNKRADTVA